MQESSASIPSFLTARSPEGLRRLMLRNNAKHAMFFKYFDIQFVNGRWYAWYILNLKTNVPFNSPEEALQGGS